MKPIRFAVAAVLAATLISAAGCGDVKPAARKPSLQSSDPEVRIQAIDGLDAKYGRKAK